MGSAPLFTVIAFVLVRARTATGLWLSRLDERHVSRGAFGSAPAVFECQTRSGLVPAQRAFFSEAGVSDGEGKADVARGVGYRDASGVLRVLKRLEALAARERSLRQQQSIDCEQLFCRESRLDLIRKRNTFVGSRARYNRGMALSNAYLFQVKNLPQILKAIREAQAPDRFTYSFLEALGFKSTNDRGIIGVLKALGFIDESGSPKQPYFDYLDDERHEEVLADGIRRAYADLFKLNNKADEKDTPWVKNKLKTLTQGAKGDAVLTKMAATFTALCKEADFTTPTVPAKEETAATTTASGETKSRKAGRPIQRDCSSRRATWSFVQH